MNMPLVLLNRRRRGFTAFSPSTLFSTTAIGIWLDPSDLSTMFSDRAGTTPVTTPGTVVGLRLDKSKGLALGADRIVNGDFASGSTSWTLGANWAVVGGAAAATASSGNINQVMAGIVVGRSYLVEFDVTVSSGSLRAELGGSFGPTVTSSGRYRAILASLTGAVSVLYIYGPTAFTGTVDNISVRELAGNHAVAPTDAARPIYGVEPKGGRRNLLTWSEDFTNAFWGGPGATVSANVTTAPNGTTTADKLAEQATSGGHLIYNVSGLTPVAGQYTDSIYLKAAERGFGFVQIATDNATKRYTVVVNLSTGAITATSSTGTPTGTASSVVSAGDGWWRVSVRADHTSSLAYILAGPVPTGVPTFDANATPIYTGTASNGIFIWGAQLELGSTATNYQRVTTAYDITESGVATCHYVQYDGSDDSMSTSAIDFTATDKMSVFAGVRKLSDAAQSVVVELSATIASNNGSFLLAAPDGATATFGFDSKGTTQVDAVASSLTAPISRIVTGLADIAGDRATIRIDGVQADQDTGDQGTGNFGNYPLFIGRRNNASLPFNGRDFGIIIVGKLASAGEITDTETWLAAKTAQVTL